MAVFGAPVALQDAPLRACRATLSILQRLKAAGPDLEAKRGIRPQLRIGLNTGAAVVGQVQEGVDAQITVLGDTVNFASRLQALAEPNSIFLSEATHRLAQGMVEASFVGEQITKGKSEPQNNGARGSIASRECWNLSHTKRRRGRRLNCRNGQRSADTTIRPHCGGGILYPRNSDV